MEKEKDRNTKGYETMMKNFRLAEKNNEAAQKAWFILRSLKEKSGVSYQRLLADAVINGYRSTPAGRLYGDEVSSDLEAEFGQSAGKRR